MNDDNKEWPPYSEDDPKKRQRDSFSDSGDDSRRASSTEYKDIFDEDATGDYRDYQVLKFKEDLQNPHNDADDSSSQRKDYPWLILPFQKQTAIKKSRPAIWRERRTPLNISSRIKINVLLSFLISLTIVCLTTATLFYSGVGKTIVGFFGFLGAASPWGIPAAAAIVVLLGMIPAYYFLKHWFFKLKTFKDTKAILSLLFSAGIVFFIVAGLFSLGLGPAIVSFLGVSATIIAIPIAMLFVSLISYFKFLIDDTIDTQWLSRRPPFERTGLILSAFLLTSAFITVFFLTVNLQPLVDLFLHGVFATNAMIQAATLLLGITVFVTSVGCLIANQFVRIDYDSERKALHDQLEKIYGYNDDSFEDSKAPTPQKAKVPSSHRKVLQHTPIGNKNNSTASHSLDGEGDDSEYDDSKVDNNRGSKSGGGMHEKPSAPENPNNQQTQHQQRSADTNHSPLSTNGRHASLLDRQGSGTDAYEHFPWEPDPDGDEPDGHWHNSPSQ